MNPQDQNSRRGLSGKEVGVIIVCAFVTIFVGVGLFGLTRESSSRLCSHCMLNQVVVATNAYRTAYGKWPSFNLTLDAAQVSPQDEWVGDPAMGAPQHNNVLFDTLRAIPRGVNVGAQANPKKIIFIEAIAARFSFSGKPIGGFFDRDGNGAGPSSTLAGSVLDPWGQEYGIIVDANNDNTIDLSRIYSDRTPVRKCVSAFSSGKDGLLGSNGNRIVGYGTANPSDDVASWE